ncbi:uncharacterized protein LOC127853601 [Dreissena polymorpha]|uniref:uncharacterized protein LOC127853601 n=1 Tax=Dreissena polymorpha TaxID=45954 RepID=UPI00226442D6|nr:uncharacterized protein LOC127853601 [Dreissena polymorpha]
MHITTSAQSKANIIAECSEQCEQSVIKAIHDGKDGKFNGDNVDIFVQTNVIRMENKSKDYHFFASDFTPYRITDSDFKENEYLVNYMKEKRNIVINIEQFKPDVDMFKHNIKILIARQLIEHPDFKWMEIAVPKHIEFPLQDVMSRKTTSFGLPVMLKNEMKYEDCVQIMDGYEKYLQEWYSKAGRSDDLNSLMVPVGGDQLTRVRLDGAKSLRAGHIQGQNGLRTCVLFWLRCFICRWIFLRKPL